MTETTTVAPDLVRVQVTPAGSWQDPARSGLRVDLQPQGRGLRVDVAGTRVARILLRWHTTRARGCRILGDAWERSYGELEWRVPRAERPLPWMFLAHDPRDDRTWGAGVEVRGGAFAFWLVDTQGVSLVLDLRSGGAAVEPGDRLLHAATVRAVEGQDSAFDTQRALAHLLCTDPLLPPQPVVGANNWYYAYGRDFDTRAVVGDARTIADLVGDHPVRPFMVVDDGWSPAGTADGLRASGGRWDRGRVPEFPDMVEVASAIRDQGVRPGIWYRPLLRREEAAPGTGHGPGAGHMPSGVGTVTTDTGRHLATVGPRDGALALDPSCAQVLDQVSEDVSRLSGWGFELIKHDFSTYDLLGRWGPDMGALGGVEGPALADPTMTTAEALVGFYRQIHRAAGDSLVLGCNVVGHLAAGHTHIVRTGDDTSGLDWDRTRRTGINTLGFRLGQHRAFFALDADCVASTPHTDWRMDRRFLGLVARSGTVLFVSVDPTTRGERVDADLAAALRLALDGGAPGGGEPLDWLDTPTPQRWRLGGETVDYEWLEPQGADPFEAWTAATPEV
ncbi:MAG: hypothetical protein ACTJGR_00835 [Pauljensenia sp.]